jgi:hypothetical protein
MARCDWDVVPVILFSLVLLGPPGSLYGLMTCLDIWNGVVFGALSACYVTAVLCLGILAWLLDAARMH